MHLCWILERDQKWNEALLHSFGFFLKGGLLKVVPVIGIVGAISFFLGLLAIYVGIMITIPFYIIFMVFSLGIAVASISVCRQLKIGKLTRSNWKNPQLTIPKKVFAMFSKKSAKRN